MGAAVICAVLIGAVFGVLSASISKALRYQPPDECKWVPVEDGISLDEDAALLCRLRTINSELENTNFSVIQPQHTIRLRIECSDALFFQSSLSAGSFQPLLELKELSIEYCKIGNLSDGAFRGLKHLRNLTVRTHNTDWSAMTLEVSRHAFSEELQHLQRLDLAENNIWTLPSGVLCPLQALQILNLTQNRLRDITHFHFTRQVTDSEQNNCGARLKLLDISRNNIERIPSGQLSALINLQKLYLQGNGLVHLADKAFEGLAALHVLKLSDNRITNVPPELFLDTHNLEEIYLQNNSINVLAPGLFNDLSQLLVLDLSSNEITEAWINTSTFMGLVRLIVLDLSHNRIARLEPSVFRDLYSLQILRLNHNFLEHVPVNTFSTLYNLQTLILSNNRLTKIDSNTFIGLFALSLLSLDNNRIYWMHNEALINCTSIHDLHLNGNKLQHVPGLVNYIPSLRTLDLGENHISQLQNDTFLNLADLYGLRLTENLIGNITKEIFDKMPSLKILNLSRNKISKITPNAFQNNTNLQAIRLDGNHLTGIDDLFSTLPNLVWLNISANYLTWFDYALIPGGLQWLDIHANEIQQLGNYFEIESSMSLTTFDASANKLTEITGSAIPNSVKLLFLNNNEITKIQPYTFFKKPNLTRVDLYGNQITTLDPNALRITAVPVDQPLPEFYIGGNPYQCDCTMEWLQKNNRIRTQPKLVDLDTIQCQLLYRRGKSNVALLEATSAQFLCTYESHCFALCHCCDFDACDCEMTCPRNCTCYHDDSWSANIVDCSRAGYVERLPDRIPMDATQLCLDGNDLRSLASHAFIGRKKLSVLYVNSSNVVTLHNRTFHGLKELRILHLQRNRISALYGYEFDGLDRLQELHLEHNRISSVHNDTFGPLKQLRLLTLAHNRLHVFNVWSAVPISVSELTLAFNPWSCRCEFSESLYRWMLERGDTISDGGLVRCILNRSTTTGIETNENVYATDSSSSSGTEDNGFFLLATGNRSRCAATAIHRHITTGTNHNGDDDQQQHQEAHNDDDDDHDDDNEINGNSSGNSGIRHKQLLYDYMPLIITALGSVVIVIIAVMLMVVFRQEMRVWFHSKFGVRLFHRSTIAIQDDRDKLFDAFVSYSSKDEAWVNEVLAPALEPEYKLCLHYRDFPVNSFIGDTIVQAVDTSKRTIMILSENFIKSEWCRFEFKSAYHQVLRDRQQRLIVVVLGEIPHKDLDPDIRLYLKTHLYLQWGDKLFWEKLKFALPDVPNNQRHRSSFREPQVHHYVHAPSARITNASSNIGANSNNAARTVAIHI